MIVIFKAGSRFRLSPYARRFKCLNYLFGTIVFSSMQLVSGQNAVKVLVLYVFVATVWPMITMWALQDAMDEHGWAEVWHLMKPTVCNST